jgi:cellulose synthase/poly-beta-1,6-N-acetylglucosamine synthase-like glycosyltransferase
MRTAREEPGVLVFRLLVVLYALCLPGYLYYRFAFTIEGAYQTLVCVLESYGALNVLLLGIIRFPRPWASAVPEPPEPEGPVDGAALISGDGSAHGPFDVAILVPCCNEPDDVVFGTLRAALALSHPLAWRVRVVLCDDGGKPARAERLRTLGPPERILYVSRPNDPNVPRHGKAGNLNYALREVVYRCGAPSADALVVVFDCDMEAHGDFLAATLPYLAVDARTALVQTPQFFYNVVPQVGLRATDDH